MVSFYSGGANNHIGTPFGMAPGEICELVRVALNGKQPCTSECVGAAIRQLHRDRPQIKMIVSYADIDQQHIGTIYQATNWIYLGDVNVDVQGAYIIHGKKIHAKTVYSNWGTNKLDWLRKNVDPKAQRITTLGKRKYIWVYDKKLRKQWQAKALPYPKKHDNTETRECTGS